MLNELSSTSEVMDFLSKRFGTYVIVYTVPEDGQYNEGDSIEMAFDGGRLQALGLMCQAERVLSDG